MLAARPRRRRRRRVKKGRRLRAAGRCERSHGYSSDAMSRAFRYRLWEWFGKIIYLPLIRWPCRVQVAPAPSASRPSASRLVVAVCAFGPVEEDFFDGAAEEASGA